MSVNYNLFFERLQEKVEEGIEKLDRTDITDRDYQMIITNLVTTAKLIKTFDEIVPNFKQESKGIKAGDEYTSFDGNTESKKIVVFTSDNCSFCNSMKPVYIPYLKEKGIYIEDVNLSEEFGSEFASNLGITGVPAFLLVKDNIVRHRFEGYNTSASEKENIKLLEDLLNKYLEV